MDPDRTHRPHNPITEMFNQLRRSASEKEDSGSDRIQEEAAVKTDKAGGHDTTSVSGQSHPKIETPEDYALALQRIGALRASPCDESMSAELKQLEAAVHYVDFSSLRRARNPTEE